MKMKNGIEVLRLSNRNIENFINILLGFQNEQKFEEEKIINKFKELKFSEEDIEKYLILLNSIKKKNIEKLLKKLKNKDIKDEKEKVTIIYSEDDILECFKNDDEYIIDKLKISDLKCMYISIYNQEPRKGMKKQDLINSIRNRIRIISRANGFNE